MPEPTYYPDEHFLDLFSSVADETDQAVRLLDEFAGAGRLLELGVGTGRLALPLARRGHAVTGIEASGRAIDALREKRDSERVEVLRGDIVTVDWGAEPYDLVYAPFGIWEVLGSAERQRAVLTKAATALRGGGHLLVEGYVPSPRRFDSRNQCVEVRHASADRIALLVAQHDPARQDINSYFVLLRDGEHVRILGEPKHYTHRRELDLEAASRGLELVHRWGGWDKRAYDGGSTHLSLYRRT